MAAPPLLFQWTGDSMVPVGRFARECDQHFTVGERYTLVTQEDRSAASHRHYFALVTEAWRNLPEEIAERFPTSEHLRRYALIRAGFADQRQIVASSRAEALRLAAFVRPMDEYAVVAVDGTVVTVWTAHSQNMRSMGKERFKASKDGVLHVLGQMIGVTPEALSRNVQEAA